MRIICQVTRLGYLLLTAGVTNAKLPLGRCLTIYISNASCLTANRMLGLGVGYGLPFVARMDMEFQRACREMLHGLLIGWHGSCSVGLSLQASVCAILAMSGRVSIQNIYGLEHHLRT